MTQKQQELWALTKASDIVVSAQQHMRSLTDPPAIQALCMKLANRMCSYYPDLQSEFIRTLRAMEIDYYKPAVKAVMRKVLGKEER